jgi:hypothetical protein
MRKLRIAQYLVCALIPILVAGCFFTRSDLLNIATAQPDIHLVPNTTHGFSFGSVEVYSTAQQNFQIENLGNGTLEIEKLYTSSAVLKQFIIDSTYTTSSLEPGETTSFTISFKPTTDEPISVDMFIVSNDPDEGIYRFSISGMGTIGSGNPPMILVKKNDNLVTIGSDAHDFGIVAVGSNASVGFTIINDISAGYELSVTDISFKSGDVTQFNRIAPNLPNSIQPGGSMDFTVEFAPEGNQSYTAAVEIRSDDPLYSSFIFFVNGIGSAEPDIRVFQGSGEIPIGDTVSFGSVYIGEHLTKDITIENAGNLLLNVTGLSVIDSNVPPVFSCTTSFPFQVPPGGSATIPIDFAPTNLWAPGLLNATIELYSDDPDESPYTFRVEGLALTVPTVPAPDINVINVETGTSVPPGSTGYDFTTVDVGTVMTASFKIENSGNKNLNVYAISLSGASDFYFGSNPSPVLIVPGTSVDFDVIYAPGGTGTHEATVFIENDDPDAGESLYMFNVQGNGVLADVPEIQVMFLTKEIACDGIYYFNDDDDAIEYPGSIEKKCTIKNKGKAELYVSGVLLVCYDAEDFTEDLTTPVMISAYSEVEFTITFNPKKAPSGLEVRSTRLEIFNNDADENPYDIDLVGYVESND